MRERTATVRQTEKNSHLGPFWVNAKSIIQNP
jgi:hypothetical protein